MLDFHENAVALVRKTCFRGFKTRVLGTLISLKINKNVPSEALARVFWGPKEPKIAENC